MRQKYSLVGIRSLGKLKFYKSKIEWAIIQFNWNLIQWRFNFTKTQRNSFKGKSNIV